MTFDDLLNLEIVAITFIHDYFQIIFKNESILNVYNKYEILWTQDSRKLIYSKVISVNLSKEKLTILLNNSCSIEIWLEDDDYNWPEAIELIFPDKQILIHRAWD